MSENIETAPYKNSELPVKDRVADLLPRMTLEEKVGQMMQLDGRGDLAELINRKYAGSLLHINGERLSGAMDMAAKTRLGIPLLIADDCIHGHSFWPGATIFPTQLSMACSWNKEGMEQAARVTATEVSCTGIKWTFSPVLCLTRDLRWGRVNETFGEDPFLIGEFAEAMIKGYQGKDFRDPTAILATAKHYAGYSETQGGRDASEADISRRKLKSFFLPPFERAAKAGCMAFMTGYQSMDGVPSSANRWLLKEVLKNEWGFKGVLVTDWDNVGRMHWEQKICATMKEASALAVKSGNDLMMSTISFFEGAIEAVAEGLLDEAEIDEVCSRILALKFELGLFENPGKPDAERQREVIACDEHKRVNAEVTRQSMVLLQNRDGVLPLAKDGAKTVAVIGPNADDPQAQQGDWSGNSGQVNWMDDGHPRECTSTVLDGIRSRAPEGWTVEYAKGCSITDEDTAGIAEAKELCAKADYAVVVVGDTIALIGESCSTATLELQGGQLKLLEELAGTGTPLIVVLINSKPLVLPKTVRDAAAIVEAFNPGMAGGDAVADLIFGNYNPSGKLTISFPYHVGQQPIYYSQIRGQHGNRYADMTQEPLFAFGHGLSFTRFEYSNLKLKMEKLGMDDSLKCSIDIKNTGKIDGVEIAQLYISDLVTSATWVNKELKGYDRVEIKAGETKTVEFEIPVANFSIVNTAGERVAEPGDFEVMVGGSSRDCDLLKAQFTVA